MGFRRWGKRSETDRGFPTMTKIRIFFKLNIHRPFFVNSWCQKNIINSVEFSILYLSRQKLFVSCLNTEERIHVIHFGSQGWRSTVFLYLTEKHPGTHPWLANEDACNKNYCIFLFWSISSCMTSKWNWSSCDIIKLRAIPPFS